MVSLPVGFNSTPAQARLKAAKRRDAQARTGRDSAGADNASGRMGDHQAPKCPWFVADLGRSPCAAHGRMVKKQKRPRLKPGAAAF